MFFVSFLYQSMPFLIFWSGSFAVQFGDHLRSNLGIICGPIWGSFAVRDHLRTRTVLVVVLVLRSKGPYLPLKENFLQDSGLEVINWTVLFTYP